MKYSILTVICLCCLITAGIGQNRKVDSLRQVLRNAKEDTAKVGILNAIAFELRNNNPDTAIYFAGLARELAIKLNDKAEIANASLITASALTNLGDYENAMKNVHDALKILDQILQLHNVKSNAESRLKVLKRKARAYNIIGNILLHQGNYPDAKKNFATALTVNDGTGDKAAIAISYNGIGNSERLQGNFPEALKNLFISLKIRKEIGDKPGMAISYGNIGSTYIDQGNFTEALEYHFISLKIKEEVGDKQGIAISYINIGLIYTEQRKFSEALKNYAAALKILKETGDKYNIAMTYNNIGLVYFQQLKYTEALPNYLASLKIAEEIGDKQGIARTYNNIGIVYHGQGNYPEALKSLFTSLKIQEEIGEKEDIARTCNYIGNVYTMQKKYNESSHYLNKGLQLAKEVGSLRDINDSYFGLAALDSIHGNFKKSLEEYKMYIAYRDSMFNQENAKKMEQSQLQYEFDKKETLAKAEQEKKDVLALKELQRQKLLRNFFIGIIVLVLVLSILIYRAYRSRQLLRLNDIRNKIAGDLHDDIGSTLNSISIYSEVAKKKGENYEEALEMIGDASRKVIDAMSDIVWTINAENDSFEKIIFRMKSLAWNLFRAKNIEFTFHSDEILNEKKLSLEQRRNFYLIFKEAVNNLVKYAGATRAAITLTNENGFIRLCIQDNGAGFDTSVENTGNGLKNMKRRAGEMKGEFYLESKPGNGTRVELVLKDSKK